MGASRGRWGQIKHSLSGFFKESKLKKKKKNTVSIQKI
jgi:hypothetical protein